MTDIWSFLLQTLTACGVAVLLLAVKAVFRDKLSPRWQFAVWGVLALILLLPAGWGGRYVLLNWPMAVEWLKSLVTGQFGTLTHVTAPVPLPPLAAPETAADWLYLLYFAGVVLLLARYLVSYILLRRALGRGRPAQGERVKAVGAQYGLPVCPAVEVDGLPTAFICGVFRPVLALPAGVETDDKVILHELLHLKYRDVAWGWLICFFCCIHWCNPLIWVCACWARSDLESLCDQRVLERLEGEDRRDYGRILLSMADEKYARAPGTSSAANGGRNIRRRIEAIARFKRYPAGMALVSVCVALVLVFPLVIGARAETINEWHTNNDTMIMASARTAWCTTYAGAFDAYAKAVLVGSVPYRAMCAPLSQQNELAAEFFRDSSPIHGWELFGLDNDPWIMYGYSIYNLTRVGEDAWEGLLVVTLPDAPEGETWDSGLDSRWLAIQKLRAEKEGERWVILPQGGFRLVQGDQRVSGNLGVPAWVYEARYGDFTIRAQWQTTAYVNSTVRYNEWSSSFDPVPKPHASFAHAYRNYMIYAIYTGSPDKKGEYTSISVSGAPIIYWEGDLESTAAPIDPKYLDTNSSGSSSWGDNFGNCILEEGWEDWIFLSGGGSGIDGGRNEAFEFPDSYAVNLYLNGKFAAELTLLPVEGGEWVEH